MTTFRAAHVASPRGQLTLADRTLVEARPGSVRVAVKACGICQSDSVFVDDLWPALRFPVTSGREIAGCKDALGEDMEGWRLWGRQGHLLRLLQGAALLAHTIDDPEFVTGKAALLKNRIQAP